MPPRLAYTSLVCLAAALPACCQAPVSCFGPDLQVNVFAERTGLPLEAAEVMVVDVGGVVLSSESCGAGCFAFNARDHVSVTVRVAGFNSMQRDSAFEAECGRVVGQRWDVALSEVGSGAESEVTFSTFAMPCAGMD